MRLAAAFLLALACVACTAESTPPATADAPAVLPAPNPSAEGWRAYPVTGKEWPTEPLDDARWVAATGDLGCIGRAAHGDPDTHRAFMARVLAHHATTAEAVMAFGIEVNASPRAGALGEQVNAAIQSCK